MSVQLMGAVISCGPREQNTYCVLNALANYADDFGFCCPSVETIAADSRCNERTVFRTLDQLVDDGWLYRARKVLNGKSNVYILNLSKLGVTVSPNGRRSPLFMRLLRSSGDRLTPIFAPEKSGDTNRFSTDNPQPPQVTETETQVTKTGGSGDRACHPNRYNRYEQNRKGTVNDVEPPPLPPRGGEVDEVGDHNPEPKGGRGKSPEPGGGRDAASTPPPAFEVDPIGPSPPVLQRWDAMRLSLKLDVGTSLHPNFTEIVPGTSSDWDGCFRDWWFLSLGREGTVWEFTTHAGNEDATRRGIEKYRSRLEARVRIYFPIPTSQAIRFIVKVPEARTSNATAAA